MPSKAAELRELPEEELLARIDSARASGLDVTADQYPYTRAATALDASIPTWA